MSSESALRRWVDRGLAALSLGLLVVFLVRSECGPVEAARTLAGILALWGPGATAFWILMGPAELDRATRGALCATASYALTGTAYFLCASVGLPVVFNVVHAGVGIWLVIRFALRVRRRDPALPRSGPNWALVALIAASLLVMLKYRIPFEVTDEGREPVHTYSIHVDHLYHVGIAYQLDRNDPAPGVLDSRRHTGPSLSPLDARQHVAPGSFHRRNSPPPGPPVLTLPRDGDPDLSRTLCLRAKGHGLGGVRSSRGDVDVPAGDSLARLDGRPSAAVLLHAVPSLHEWTRARGRRIALP